MEEWEYVFKKYKKDAESLSETDADQLSSFVACTWRFVTGKIEYKRPTTGRFSKYKTVDAEDDKTIPRFEIFAYGSGNNSAPTFLSLLDDLNDKTFGSLHLPSIVDPNDSNTLLKSYWAAVRSHLKARVADLAIDDPILQKIARQVLNKLAWFTNPVSNSIIPLGIPLLTPKFVFHFAEAFRKFEDALTEVFRTPHSPILY